MSKTQTVELTEEVMNEVRLAKTELGEMLANQNRIVERIGHAVAKDPMLGENPAKICVIIKHLLAEEVSKGIISFRTIENACLPEWKDAAKSAAGAVGGEKTAAERREKVVETQAIDEAKVEEFNARLSRIKARLNKVQTAAEDVVHAAKQEGDFVKVPKDIFAALAEVVRG